MKIAHPRSKYTAEELRLLDAQRLLAKVDLGSDRSDCWQWTGYIKPDGYTVFSFGASLQTSGHRAAWMLFRGPIDPALVIDHICRNRSCVNPSHLRQITGAENVLIGTGPTARNLAKTHCKRGHPLFGTNVRYQQGGRLCLTCKAADDRRRYLARKNAA